MRQAKAMGLSVWVSSLLILSAAACTQSPPSASAPKISHGAPVTAADLGPERYATVGLTAYGAAGSYTCSAAIIGADILVTAAHCVAPGAQIYAYFGPDMRSASAAEFTAVEAAVVHPAFAPSDTAGDLPRNDIALLHLAQPVPAGYQAAPILPDDSALHVGDAVELAGYGITERGHDSGLLRFTRTTFVGPDQKGRLQINDPERRGACSGDSGGPLYGLVDGVFYVAGVLSGGPIPCRGINLYTSLAQQKEFIDATVAGFTN